MKAYAALFLVPFLVLTACDTGGRDEQPEDTSEAYAPDPDAVTEPAQQADRDAPAAPAPGTAAREQRGPAGGATTAEARIEPTEGNEAEGLVRFSAEEGMVTIAGTINGLEPGAHGLHVHENGDCSAPDASSAGEHFNPDDKPHGSPRDEGNHHVGDLGNITADADGEAEVSLDDPDMQLSGQDSVAGKALVVHAGQDDFETQPSGNSGARIGCGVIRATAGGGT